MELKQDKPPGRGRLINRPAPKDAAEHFMICPVCGQAFDARDLAQVLRHAEAGHDPEPRS